MAVIEEALAAYRALPVCIGMVHALFRKYALLLARGQFAEAFDLARTAAQVAEQVGDARVHRNALSLVAWHEGVEGSWDQAVRTMREATSLVSADFDPEGDIRQAMLLTDVLLLTGGSSDAIDLVGMPGLAVAARWEIESYHALLVRSNVVSGRIRQGRVADAAGLVDALSEGPVDVDRWPLHLDRALLDCLRGHGDLAMERIDSLLETFGHRHRVIGDDLEFLVDVATIYLWNIEASDAIALLLPALDAMVDSSLACFTHPAMLCAARAAADETSGDVPLARQYFDTLMGLHSRLPRNPASLELDEQSLTPPYARALAASWRAEMTRLKGTGTVALWVAAADAWDRLFRPHDAAYCRWRAAQCALLEGRGTVAARLLKRATSDAREHVPLLNAIARTAAGNH